MKKSFMVTILLLVSTLTAQAELRRAEIKVFGMD